MVIDWILDRENGEKYSPRDFYNYCVEEGQQKIARALDSGENSDVQNALADYVTRNNYNNFILPYIFSVDWIEKA